MTRLATSPPAWRHDLGHCLHAACGALVAACGFDPLEVLGARWSFYYRDGDVRREEYYFPCPPGTSLLEALAPYHDLRSRWHTPPDAAAGWQQVRAKLAAGHVVGLAVDNYFLPYRPAFGDVHTNHLLVAYGFDDRAQTVDVLDAVPPSFRGALPLAQLTAARNSANPAQHERDRFFTKAPIQSRWLELEVTGSAEPLTAAVAAAAIRQNVADFRNGATDGAFVGSDGLRRFWTNAVARLAAGEPLVDELFVLAGAVLAQTGVHADYLSHAARTLDAPKLAEASRRVDRVAHHWTALRIAIARAREGEAYGQRLARRLRELTDDLERALDELEGACEELESVL